MEHDFGAVFGEHGLDLRRIADIHAQIGLKLTAYARKHVVVAFGSGIQSQADHLRTHFVQPNGEPTALEARMPRQQDPLAFIEMPKISQHI